MMIYRDIEGLVYYAQAHLYLDDLDVIYVRNRLLDELKLTDYEVYEVEYDMIDGLTSPDMLLEPVVKYALETGIVAESKAESFGNGIMDILSRRPSEVVDIFEETKEMQGSVKACDWFFDYCIKNNYIKSSAIAKNKHWDAKGTKGKLEITINLSKPEKSNKDVAQAAKATTSKYPPCVICVENEGYNGGNTTRQNLRTIPITLGGKSFKWQYSPYAYYNQHCIVINEEHTPMKVDHETLVELVDFIDYLPHFFIGCNAALPIVGGSILAHDHFQGGNKLLPMMKAKDRKVLDNTVSSLMTISIVDWYNSVIRLIGTDKNKIIETGSKIIEAWKCYNDAEFGIEAVTSAPHNAVTPIVRKVDGKYCLELILRNNSVSDEFPDGVFHAHPEYHNIKSESIGLIEAMGLFILPGRLERQLAEVEKYVARTVKYSASALTEDMKIHQPMIEKLMKECGAKVTELEAHLNVKDEVDRICECILDNTSVFKSDDTALERFLLSVGIIK